MSHHPVVSSPFSAAELRPISGAASTARLAPPDIDAGRRSEDLLLLVDFKWLMAGIGWWVDLTRWRRDEDYAHDCLARALESDNALLRERARHVLERGLVPVH